MLITADAHIVGGSYVCNIVPAFHINRRRRPESLRSWQTRVFNKYNM